MTVFTYSETRLWLAAMLDPTKRKGETLIQRRDGLLFQIRKISMPQFHFEFDRDPGAAMERVSASEGTGHA
jgi:hypothetical protein